MRKLTYLAWPLLVVPALLIFLGAAMNQVAMLANHAVMPVYYHNCNTDDLDDTHSCMDKSTRLKFLCDWVNEKTSVQSPGDLSILAGEWLYDPFIFAWLTFAFIALHRAYPFGTASRLSPPVQKVDSEQKALASTASYIFDARKLQEIGASITETCAAEKASLGKVRAPRAKTHGSS